MALSDYEKIRATNIERNNARLRALGLISVREEEESNVLAWKRQLPPSSIGKNLASSIGDIKKRKRESATGIATSSRKSLRLQGKQPDGKEVIADDNDNTSSSSSSIEAERKARVQECREVRMKLALRFASQTDAEKKAAKENPSASYEHCTMRIRTMTDKALANRVKAIERAAGKHSVIKMAIFKSCLQDFGKWDLAYLANQALERLKALKAPIEEE